MDYNRIVAVTGMPGLYEVISSKTDGAIVRSLEDQSTKFVSSRIHNLSHLESIEVYTVRENVTLSDVFTAMRESKTALPDVKKNDALQNYFKNVFPDLDFDRVYASDMKKMVKWFEVLNANEVDFTVKPEEEEEEEETATVVKEKPAATEKIKTEPKPKQEAPAKAKEKAPEPKAAAPKAEVKPAAKKQAAAKEENKPAKKAATKTASKKAAAPKKAAPAKKAAAKKAAPKKKK